MNTQNNASDDFNGTAYAITILKPFGMLPIGFRKVGITKQDIKTRLCQHISQARGGRKGHIFDFIRNRIPTDARVVNLENGVYGIEGLLKIEVIMSGISNQTSLSRVENPFIVLLKTKWPYGFNIRDGGQHPSAPQRTCTVPGCEAKHLCMGLCYFHYGRKQQGVELDKPFVKQIAQQRRAEVMRMHVARFPVKEIARQQCIHINSAYRIIRQGKAEIAQLLRRLETIKQSGRKK